MFQEFAFDDTKPALRNAVNYLTPNEAEMGRLIYCILTGHSTFGVIEKKLPASEYSGYLSVVADAYNKNISLDTLEVLLLALLQEEISNDRDKNPTTNSIPPSKDMFDKAGV